MQTYHVNGIDLIAMDQGKGMPLLLAHAFPLNRAVWNAQINDCSERYHVIAPDLRGFGTSGVTEGKVTMEQFADDLVALLDAMGVQEPVVFCGLSMGGYIAWEFWRKYRHRVRGLILCDTRATADSPEAAVNRLALADQVLREGLGPVAEGMLPRLTAETTPRLFPERIEMIRRMIFSNDPRGVAAASRGMAERADATPWLSQIGCPTLVLVGQHDVLSPPAEMRAMAERIPGARIVEIQAAGHLSPMENPSEASAAILSFLGELKG